jgi:hypothetical protein
VFGARFGARAFYQAFASATEFAGSSKAQVNFRQRRISIG